MNLIKSARYGGMLILCLALSGCRGVSISDPGTWRPPERKDPAIYSAYGPTASEKIGQLRQLAEDAHTLSAQRQQEYSASLLDRINSESDASLRVEIARALGRFSTDKAAEGLRVAMRDSDHHVRIAAAEGWSNRRDETALQALAEMLHSESNEDVQIAAARGLQHFQSPQAVSALSLALDSRNPALQRRALASLRDASGRDFGNDIPAWQAYAQGETPRPRNRETSIASQWWKIW